MFNEVFLSQEISVQSFVELHRVLTESNLHKKINLYFIELKGLQLILASFPFRSTENTMGSHLSENCSNLWMKKSCKF